MENLEEALHNIDVFCRVLVKKIVEDTDYSQGVVVEPIEKLLQRKYIAEEHLEPDHLTKLLIPLPHAEEPLIDIFENDDYVKVLMQCHCKDKKVKVHTDVDNMEICTDECRKLNLSVKHLQLENMVIRCNNNEILEINIPKSITPKIHDS
jgi:DNA-binding MarR family transcriptional regulator